LIVVDELDPKGVPEYFSHRGTVERWWDPDTGPLRFHYEAELSILDERLEIDSHARILDVGTGRGRFALHLAERGRRVTAVDINPEMLEVAKEAAEKRGVAGRIDFHEARAEDLSALSEEPFDLVFCMELFDHLPDLRAALTSIGGVLAAKGYFVFTYVPSESLYGRIGNIYRWLRRRFRPQSMMISRTYSLAEVEALLAASGFALERHYGVGILCINAQTRLFRGSLLERAALAVARWEARRWPYYERPGLARRGAHVVGIARPLARSGS
jgi:2-polyprenyl-3-methyl-5-hydroxy-6-metoxy-1,4-benzoquinol methylase